MYDPLALVASIPSLEYLFDFEEFVVDGTVHRVIGTAKDRTGIRKPAVLQEWLAVAFKQGLVPTHSREEKSAVDDSSLSFSKGGSFSKGAAVPLLA